MRLPCSCALLVALFLLIACSPLHAQKGRGAVAAPPVVQNGQVRESLPNDYLRVSFLPSGVTVTSLSRPGALRAFVTATSMFQPPMKLADLPAYSGLVNNDNSDLVAMRCRPPAPETVDAVLATWPNVFLAIERDIPVTADACTASPSDVSTQIACYARGFTDAAGSSVPSSLARAFNYAGALFDADHTTLASWLKDKYGIFSAFSGMGYSVKDSYNLDTEPMTAQQILVKSISPEYIMKNVSLTDAGCRCIRVPPYSGRSSDRLDPDFIAKAGGNGSCVQVNRLAKASH